MDQFIELLNMYPFLIWVILILAVIAIPLIISLVVTAVRQGRELKTPWISLGPKLQESLKIGEEEIKKIAQRVQEELSTYRQEEGLTEESLSPDIQDFPEYTINLFKMDLMIGRKIRDIVLGWGGGWAGHSWASFETYFDLAQSHKLVDESIFKEIGEFKWISNPGIFGDDISEGQYRDAEQLAGKILRQLDEIIIEPNFK
ncbi:MAG: hypothetical protein MUO76_04520 [Anaerolineaceae bacterium]|nr:hypothetical protein [Anaerolineaceae bacterium]